MRRTPPWLLLAFSLPCVAGSAGCDDLRERPINRAVDWQLEIKPILNNTLGGRCSGCHNGGFPDFTDFGVDAIYKLVGSYVLPGQPLQSALFNKVNCITPLAGSRMPLGSTPLSLAEQALIYDWIEQGALGEPDAAITRDFLFRDGAESLRLY